MMLILSLTMTPAFAAAWRRQRRSWRRRAVIRGGGGGGHGGGGYHGGGGGGYISGGGGYIGGGGGYGGYHGGYSGYGGYHGGYGGYGRGYYGGYGRGFGVYLGGYPGYYGDYGSGYDNYPSYGYTSSAAYYNPDLVPPVLSSSSITVAPTSDQTAHIRVEVPDPNAQVYFDGYATRQRGNERAFATPPPCSGADVPLHHRGKMDGGNGQEVSKTRTVTVNPGGSATVVF